MNYKWGLSLIGINVIGMVTLVSVCLKDNSDNRPTASRTYGDADIVLTSVHDGDTFTGDVAGWPPIVGAGIEVRVYGIDCAEIYDQHEKLRSLARLAKEEAEHFLHQGKIELHNLRRDKYFRINADVFVGGQSLADHLIQQGLAKAYDGGTKPSWSDRDYSNYIKSKKKQP